MALKREEFRKTSKFKFNLLWCQHCKAMQKANETVVACYYNPLSEEGEFSFCAISTDAIDSILEAHKAGVREIFEAYDNLLDGMGYGIDDFKLSAWQWVEELKQKYGGE